jgi:hypothetical protein
MSIDAELLPHQQYLNENHDREQYLEAAVAAGFTPGDIDRLDWAVLEHGRALKRSDDPERLELAKLELKRAVKSGLLARIVKRP